MYACVRVRVRVRVREGEIKKKKQTSEPSLFILLPRHCETRGGETQVSWPAFQKKKRRRRCALSNEWIGAQ